MKGSELLRVIGAQVCLHATMAGMRLATPLLANLAIVALALGLSWLTFRRQELGG